MKQHITLAALAVTLCTTTYAQRETWQINPRIDIGIPVGNMGDLEATGTGIGLAVGLAYHPDNYKRHAVLADIDFGGITSELDGWDPVAYAGIGIGYGYNLTEAFKSLTVRPQLTLSVTRVAWYTGTQELLGETITYDSDPLTTVFIRPGVLVGYQVGRVWLGMQAQYSTGTFDPEYTVTTSSNLIFASLEGEVSWRLLQFSPTIIFNL